METSVNKFASPALILGATGAIGRAIGQRLMDEKVFVTGVARRSPINDVDACAWSNLLLGDIVEPGFLESIDYDFQQSNTSPALIVHSVARYCSNLPPTIKDEQEIFDLNLNSARRTIDIFSPHMMKRGSGRILLIGSIAALRGSRCLSYAESKKGLILLMQEKSVMLARYGVTINVLLPGPVDSTFFRQTCDEYRQKEYLSEIPMGRFARTQDVSAVAAFLLSQEAEYVTGSAIPISGGLL